MSLRYRYIIALLIGAAIFMADQISKKWVEAAYPLWGGTTVIDGFFNITLVHNHGAVFGLLADQEAAWPKVLFIGATVLAIMLIMYLLHSRIAGRFIVSASLGLILGGAVGNLLDRIETGRVTDFLDLYVGQHHWPAFNVADVSITVGAFILLVAMYFSRHSGAGGKTR